MYIFVYIYIHVRGSNGSKTKFVTNEFSNGGNTGRRYFREIISRCVPGSKYSLLTDKGTRTYSPDIPRVGRYPYRCMSAW